jgi:hypothetical protein
MKFLFIFFIFHLHILEEHLSKSFFVNVYSLEWTIKYQILIYAHVAMTFELNGGETGQ